METGSTQDFVSQMVDLNNRRKELEVIDLEEIDRGLDEQERTELEIIDLAEIDKGMEEQERNANAVYQ